MAYQSHSNHEVASSSSRIAFAWEWSGSSSPWTDGWRVARDFSSSDDLRWPRRSIAWVAAKGCVPIPGANNLAHARSNVAAAAIELTPEEVARLDAASLASRDGHMVQNIFNTS